MLVLHHHPDNQGKKAPKMLYSYQKVYPRTKVDANSRWGLDWQGVSQAHLVTDLESAGLREGTCFIQCEQGDLVIDCESCIAMSWTFPRRTDQS